MRHAWVIRVGFVVLLGIMVLSAGLILVADAAFAKGKPVAVPRVEDANGELVGPVIGDPAQLAANPLVALTIPVPSIVVQVAPNQFLGNAHLYFTTTDCSGQPYFVESVINQPQLFPFVGVANSILYGPRANSTPATITINSYLDAFTGICRPVVQTGVYRAADSIFDLSTQFTPPFKFVYP